MHKHNWEVANPPHYSATVKPAASEPTKSASFGWRQECHSAEAEGGRRNP